METTSKFAGSVGISLVGKAVKKGEKVTSSSRPELILESTKDKFTLNGKAQKLLNIAEGETVVIYDNAEAISIEVDGQTYETRFMISKGYNKGSLLQGAKLGKNGGCSYTKVWGAMLNNEDGVMELTMADLVRKELVIAYNTINPETKEITDSVSHISTKKLRYELVPVGSIEVDEYKGESIYADTFILTNVEVSDHEANITEEQIIK